MRTAHDESAVCQSCHRAKARRRPWHPSPWPTHIGSTTSHTPSPPGSALRAVGDLESGRVVQKLIQGASPSSGPDVSSHWRASLRLSGQAAAREMSAGGETELAMCMVQLHWTLAGSAEHGVPRVTGLQGRPWQGSYVPSVWGVSLYRRNNHVRSHQQLSSVQPVPQQPPPQPRSGMIKRGPAHGPCGSRRGEINTIPWIAIADPATRWRAEPDANCTKRPWPHAGVNRGSRSVKCGLPVNWA